MHQKTRKQKSCCQPEAAHRHSWFLSNNWHVNDIPGMSRQLLFPAVFPLAQHFVGLERTLTCARFHGVTSSPRFCLSAHSPEKLQSKQPFTLKQSRTQSGGNNGRRRCRHIIYLLLSSSVAATNGASKHSNNGGRDGHNG